MSTIYVFDMDGTLYDTRAANEKAYLEAGLPEYKPEYYCRTAADWGCPPEIHERKQQLLPQYSWMIKPTWAYPFFEIAEKCGRAIVLTGASAGSVRLIENIHGRPLPTPFGITLSEADKRRILLNLTRAGWEVVYYDDNMEMGRRICLGTNMVVQGISLVTPEDIE